MNPCMNFALPCKIKQGLKPIEKGVKAMLSEKELMLLEDYLTHAQSTAESMNNLANSLQDAQSKQLFQQISQKNSQNAQMMSKHLNAGQNIQ